MYGTAPVADASAMLATCSEGVSDSPREKWVYRLFGSRLLAPVPIRIQWVIDIRQ